MNVQFRKLTSRKDDGAHAMVRDARFEQNKSFLDDVPVLRLARIGRIASNYAASEVVARVSAPRAVEGTDGEASPEELGQMLRALKLAPSDLVNPGDGWRTLEDYPPVIDEVEVWRRKTRLLNAARFAGKLALAVGSIGGILTGLWYYFGGHAP